MKTFLKMTLAVIVGVLAVTIISTAITFGIIGSIGSSVKSSAPIPAEAVLKIDLSNTIIAEQGVEMNPMALMQGQDINIRTVGLWDAVRAINAAASDPAVKMLYLKIDGNMSSLASLEELRAAVKNFSTTSSKPVIAYTESPSTGGYYFGCVADKVYMTSYRGATTMLTGIGSQMIFLKDILDRLGVNVQLIRHGKYKSAGEMFVKNAPSSENMEQNQEMVNSMWNVMAQAIADSRGISTDDLNAAIDGLKLNLPTDFLEEKLVDGLLTREELKERIAALAVATDFSKVHIVEFADYIDALAPQSYKVRNKIAVVYADGEIVDGAVNQQVAGDRFATIISKVRADSTVKAVVLRVNSPGGSVIASEKIKNELDLLKEVKPLVASYGNYAASGGYWISANCDKIYSDATTLTGSIGVFSMIPDLSRTMKSIAHVNVVSVTSNKHADMYSLMRPLDQSESAYMQRSVEDIYDTFTSIVAGGRGLEVKYVDSIAQGRVWTGSDAIGNGLVDEIGTLEDAIRYAAICAGEPELSSWRVEGYPKPLTAMEELMVMFNNTKTDEEKIFSGTILEDAAGTLSRWARGAAKGKADVMFARLPYEIEIH